MNVTVAFGVPVKVTEVLEFAQIVVLPLIVTVGTGSTVMVIVPDWGWLHVGVPVKMASTKVNIVVVLYVLVIVAVPVASKVMFRFPPLLIV